MAFGSHASWDVLRWQRILLFILILALSLELAKPTCDIDEQNQSCLSALVRICATGGTGEDLGERCESQCLNEYCAGHPYDKNSCCSWFENACERSGMEPTPPACQPKYDFKRCSHYVRQFNCPFECHLCPTRIRQTRHEVQIRGAKFSKSVYI